jgi:hypothetical protein
MTGFKASDRLNCFINDAFTEEIDSLLKLRSDRLPKSS